MNFEQMNNKNCQEKKKPVRETPKMISKISDFFVFNTKSFFFDTSIDKVIVLGEEMKKLIFLYFFH